MQVKLKVLLGAAAGQEIKIPRAKFLIGRGEECHLRPRSEAISRQHCAIVTNESRVAVRDLQSRNGTLVNGQTIEGVRELQSGDKLQIGPLAFEVMVDYPVGGAKRPVVRDVREVAERTAHAQPEDFDIAEWLDINEPDTPAQEATTPETRQFHLHETSNVALDTDTDVTGDKTAGSEDSLTETGFAQPADKAAGEVTADQTDKIKTKKDGPGKLPPAPKLSAADSREAAADMLKRFFNRR